MFFWRGDVEGGIINEDGFRAAESIPFTSPHTCTSIQSRGLRFLSSTGQWGQLCTLQPGPPNVSLHTQPQLEAVSHIPLSWQGTLQDNGFYNWIRTPRHTNRSRRKNYRYQRNNYTELAEGRCARRKLLWSYRKPRQAPYFLGARELSSAQCRWRVPLFRSR